MVYGTFDSPTDANIFLYVKEWQQFEEAIQHDYVPGFGKKLSSILDRCLSE